jgi:hypothetical protein
VHPLGCQRCLLEKHIQLALTDIEDGRSPLQGA